jgi:hypothetical protein
MHKLPPKLGIEFGVEGVGAARDCKEIAEG